MVRECMLLAAIFLAIICGCGDKAANATHEHEREAFLWYTERIAALESMNFEIGCKSCTIEIYSSGSSEIVFEIKKKAKGAYTAEKLENELEYFDILLKSGGGGITFKTYYRGRLKEHIEFGVDLRVYVPKNTRSLSCKLNEGVIIIHDALECDFKAEAKKATIEMNRFEGKMNIKSDLCNLRVSDGKLKTGSVVEAGKGNIFVKSEYGIEGDYFIKTGIGNIDLLVPPKMKAYIESVGTFETNELGTGDFPLKLRLETGMGRISVKKMKSE